MRAEPSATLCVVFLKAPSDDRRRVTTYWQPGNLNDVIHVLHLNVPKAFRYSDVNQNVQSSTGSTVMEL